MDFMASVLVNKNLQLVAGLIACCGNIQIQPSLKVELAFFFPHISKAQHLALVRTRTRVVRLGAQCTDHQTTEQSHGIGVPALQLTMHVKSSTLYGHMVIQLYGRTSKFFRPDELLLFCIIMGLCSTNSANIVLEYSLSIIFWQIAFFCLSLGILMSNKCICS